MVSLVPKLSQRAGRYLIATSASTAIRFFGKGTQTVALIWASEQIGLYSEDYIREQIVDPRKDQAPGYEDKKSKKAMPTYYEEDLSEDELSVLISYLKTLRNPTSMPVEGKFPNQWTWWDDPKIIAEGKVVFEGLEPATEGLNCAVCHGTEGIPMMTGALDFRNAENMDTDKMPDQAKRCQNARLAGRTLVQARHPRDRRYSDGTMGNDIPASIFMESRSLRAEPSTIPWINVQRKDQFLLSPQRRK